MGGPQEAKALSTPNPLLPLPHLLCPTSFRKACLLAISIIWCCVMNYLPTSLLNQQKTKIKLATHVLGSRGGGRSVLIRSSLPSEVKTGDLFHNAGCSWQVSVD